IVFDRKLLRFSRRLVIHNKQFKSDSPRLAFLVWVKLSVYDVQVECRGSVAHTLIGRYKP
ncbi:hypothetical protein CGK11_22875, partial [Vibrio parahaemolyticus]